MDNKEVIYVAVCLELCEMSILLRRRFILNVHSGEHDGLACQQGFVSKAYFDGFRIPCFDFGQEFHRYVLLCAKKEQMWYRLELANIGSLFS